MVEIKEVTTRKQINEFVNFPQRLYKGNPYFVPPLLCDEKALFNSKKNVSYDDSEAVYYLAYRDGQVVGRVAGIIQKLYNAKVNEKRVRFSRFDSIDDLEVSRALFSAVENWGRNKGMEILHGPLGFNDLEREGLLIEGFDQLGTFEEQYNYEYYAKLIEDYGFEKEVDWYEYRIQGPKVIDERINRISKLVLKRYNLHIAPTESKRKYIKKYREGIFKVLDAAYAPLHGTVPFTPKVRDSIIAQFMLIIDMRFVVTVLDENDSVVAFGVAFPSLSASVQKSKGRLFPFGVFRILHQIKHIKNIDFGLIAIHPEYQNKGVNSIILNGLFETMVDNNIEYADTNLMLEYNNRIQSQWDVFDHVQNKKRRCYVKKIDAK